MRDRTKTPSPHQRVNEVDRNRREGRGPEVVVAAAVAERPADERQPREVRRLQECGGAGGPQGGGEEYGAPKDEGTHGSGPQGGEE